MVFVRSAIEGVFCLFLGHCCFAAVLFGCLGTRLATRMWRHRCLHYHPPPLIVWASVCLACRKVMIFSDDDNNGYPKYWEESSFIKLF